MIGVVGAGIMGKGIAIEFARFNHKVVLLSVQRHLSHELLENEINKLIDKYNFDNKQMILDNITSTNEFSCLGQCDLIIEAVSENLEMKRATMLEVSHYSKQSKVFASNTSSLSIKDIFEDIVPLDSVVGLHFFNPVQVMKLVELSYLEETSDLTIKFAKDFAETLEKEVVLVKNSPGFIVNRLLIPLINEAAKILEEGVASAEDIDRAMKFGANHPMGPLRLSDLIGNDVTLAILNTLQALNPQLDISKVLIEKVSNNQLGRKTSHGFYDYSKR